MRQFSARFQRSTIPSAQSLQPSSASNDLEADVIDDSEPEREYRRQQKKAARKCSKRLHLPRTHTSEVIELTDSDNTSPIAIEPTATPPFVASVVDVSGVHGRYT